MRIAATELEAHKTGWLGGFRWRLNPEDVARLEAELDREPRVVPELAALVDRYGDPQQVGVGDPDR